MYDLQPEGVENNFVKAWFVELPINNSITTDTESLSVGYPDINVVDGSQVIKVHAMGELQQRRRWFTAEHVFTADLMACVYS